MPVCDKNNKSNENKNNNQTGTKTRKTTIFNHGQWPQQQQHKQQQCHSWCLTRGGTKLDQEATSAAAEGQPNTAMTMTMMTTRTTNNITRSSIWMDHCE